MAKQSIQSITERTIITIRPKTSVGTKRCPVCGKFMGGNRK